MQTEHDGRDDPQRVERLMIARNLHLFDVFQLVENLPLAPDTPDRIP